MISKETVISILRDRIFMLNMDSDFMTPEDKARVNCMISIISIIKGLPEEG